MKTQAIAQRKLATPPYFLCRLRTTITFCTTILVPCINIDKPSFPTVGLTSERQEKLFLREKSFSPYSIWIVDKSAVRYSSWRTKLVDYFLFLEHLLSQGVSPLQTHLHFTSSSGHCTPKLFCPLHLTDLQALPCRITRDR